MLLTMNTIDYCLNQSNEKLNRTRNELFETKKN